jgi:integrase
MLAALSAKSTSTQKRAWSILTAALRMAEDRGLVRRNVARQAEPPKVIYRERPVLTTVEAKEVLGELAGPPQDWLYPLYVLSISTGLRQGEALALKWSEVDLDAGAIQVTGTLDRTERTTVAPKTAKSRRTLKIGPEVVEALRQQQLRQKVEESEGLDGLVFTSDEGTPLYDSTVRRHWRDICVRLNLHLDDESRPTLHWHDIRHSAAVLMLQAGVSAETVAWRLGHSSLNMVVRTYGWTSTNTYEDAADAMTAILS